MVSRGGDDGQGHLTPGKHEEAQRHEHVVQQGHDAAEGELKLIADADVKQNHPEAAEDGHPRLVFSSSPTFGADRLDAAHLDRRRPASP